MNPDMQLALLLLLVGMIVVFTVLALVVGSGYLLIHLVNRFGAEVRPGRSARAAPVPSQPSTAEEERLAVLVAAVRAATGGRGHIQAIDRLP